VSYAIAAEAQAVLEGSPLPARRAELLAYARAQGARPAVLVALRELADREFRTLDQVGEELAHVQPSSPARSPHPRTESGRVPGGDDYTRAADDGDVLHAG